MSRVRELAWQLLNRCEASEQYSNLALDATLRREELSGADRGLLTAIVYGVLERRLTLDSWIWALASRAPEEIDLPTKNLLRMGLYQLAYLDRIPDHAAVNETVSLAGKRTRGFVNAVLRSFLRAEKRIAPPDAKREPIAYLSAVYSFAPEICQEFVRVFGFERSESLLAAFGEAAGLTLRTNTLRISREALLQRLREGGADARETVESRVGITLPSAPVTSLAGFETGDFFVQDEASQLCVEALDARDGMTVIDVCACPGSKSFGAAIDMQNRGRVISCDLHRNKLSLVESGAKRLGLSILETAARDARDTETAWLGIADRVLCDVPCSGFGVFSKKPELRYKDPKGSEALPDIQLAILKSACRYVKVGGLVVYSTCTLLPRENGENVARFLREEPDFTLLRERTLYPDTDGTDGFYFAVLGRREGNH